MKMDVQTILHEQQRYNTVGDWWFDDDDSQGEVTLHIRVSKMEDERYEIGVTIHELTEAIFCYVEGVTEKAVTQFDEDYEKAVALGHIKETPYIAEPGDVASAPYYNQHAFALGIEFLFLARMDVVRALYLEAQDRLYRPKEDDRDSTGCVREDSRDNSCPP